MAKREQRAVPMKPRGRKAPELDPQQFAEDMRRREESERQNRMQELEQQLSELQQELILAVRGIISRCRNCGGEKILIKTSHHLVDPGNDIFGPAGRGPSFVTHLDFLFCEDCGEVYYTSKVGDIRKILAQIERVQEKPLKVRGYPCSWPDPDDLVEIVMRRTGPETA